jgi:hypothetical protein
VQRGFCTFLVETSDRLFDEVVATVAGLRALDRSVPRAHEYNVLLVDLVWALEVHRRAPLYRPAVAASVSEADDVGTEMPAEGAWPCCCCWRTMLVHFGSIHVYSKPWAT